MMETKPIQDVIKAAAPLTETTGKSILMKDSDGNLGGISSSLFAITKKVQLYNGSVLRIQNIKSALISIRGLQGTRSTLIWISSYGNGTLIRTLCKAIYLSEHYEFFINGNSESSASAYIRLTTTANSDIVAVTSLFGEEPIIETVSALPSDATKLTIT